jgi:hypothetical protein
VICFANNSLVIFWLPHTGELHEQGFHWFGHKTAQPSLEKLGCYNKKIQQQLSDLTQSAHFYWIHAEPSKPAGGFVDKNSGIWVPPSMFSTMSCRVEARWQEKNFISAHKRGT